MSVFMTYMDPVSWPAVSSSRFNETIRPHQPGCDIDLGPGHCSGMLQTTRGTTGDIHRDLPVRHGESETTAVCVPSRGQRRLCRRQGRLMTLTFASPSYPACTPRRSVLMPTWFHSVFRVPARHRDKVSRDALDAKHVSCCPARNREAQARTPESPPDSR